MLWFMIAFTTLKTWVKAVVGVEDSNGSSSCTSSVIYLSLDVVARLVSVAKVR